MSCLSKGNIVMGNSILPEIMFWEQKFWRTESTMTPGMLYASLPIIRNFNWTLGLCRPTIMVLNYACAGI